MKPINIISGPELYSGYCILRENPRTGWFCILPNKIFPNNNYVSGQLNDISAYELFKSVAVLEFEKIIIQKNLVCMYILEV